MSQFQQNQINELKALLDQLAARIAAVEAKIEGKRETLKLKQKNGEAH